MFSIGSPYHMFMMEADRKSNIENAIKDFKRLLSRGVNINNAGIQANVLKENHLSNLTEDERNYISDNVI